VYDARALDGLDELTRDYTHDELVALRARGGRLFDV
jgi:hypothetical protein